MVVVVVVIVSTIRVEVEEEEETPRIELQRTIDYLTVIEGSFVKTGAQNSIHYLRL